MSKFKFPPKHELAASVRMHIEVRAEIERICLEEYGLDLIVDLGVSKSGRLLVVTFEAEAPIFFNGKGYGMESPCFMFDTSEDADWRIALRHAHEVEKALSGGVN